MSNRLSKETSPYLLEHANNPTDWYPWGEEALEKAKREDKPIFLSIGYSACHWCHVMAAESFEDPETARLMNENFVNIKVDREERPDLDSIYMDAVVGMTGQGGWPMSVFLTPDGVPFYGGTYFPNKRRYGMPAFTDVLMSIANAWQTQRAEIAENGAQLKATLEQGDLPEKLRGDTLLETGTLEEAAENIYRAFDWEEGGWGGAPKFPQAMTLEFLIRRYTQTRDELVLKMITLTLNKMARGGIYDQLGGGFHRYSTDDIWLVPHFEKMLYDNAQLARVYLHAWQITGDPFYKRITTEILDYVAREMMDANGGFYSSQDADSEGHEGKFFVWTPAEIRAALGGSTILIASSKPVVDNTQLFLDAYGVTEGGNFEGKNILFAARDPDVLAAMHHTSIEDVEARLATARAKLFAAREQRVKPARDEKELTGWNGLMLAAFAEAARVLNSEQYSVNSNRYTEIAMRNADFLLKNLTADGGPRTEAASSSSVVGRRSSLRLFRSYKDGRAHLNGYLEDYSNLAEGLLALYETTFEEKYFVAARELADVILEHFADPRGGFFDTSDDHETLLTRPKNVQDNAVPSGSAMAATVLLKLGAYCGDGGYTDAAESALRIVQPALGQAPTGFGQWLCALDFDLAPPKEIAIISPHPDVSSRIMPEIDGVRDNTSPQPPSTSSGQALSQGARGEGAGELLDVVFGEYRPNQVVALKRADAESLIPLLDYREAKDGRATAYVCQNFACRMPVTDAEALTKQLEGEK